MSFRSTKGQAAVLGAVRLTPLTLESQYLKIQRRGESDCIEKNLKVGASNLGATASTYLGGYSVF